ncbi:MAG TPA: ActS/PrrB/RegB family redox-sensitive histidine kinase [Caulobacteraceae bacterium]
MSAGSNPAPLLAADLLDRTGAFLVQGEVTASRALLRLRRVRQRTLVLLRWVAVTGQAAVVLGVHFGLGFDLPLAACLAVISASAWLNVGLSLALPMQRHLSEEETTLQLCFDLLQLSLLLGLTGGMNNPFVLVLVGPIAVGAAALPLRPALALVALGLVCATVLKDFHAPLPWTGDGLDLPGLYEVAMWAATMVGMVFAAGYAWSASRESARMELALAATQAVLAREQRLGALGALAAAAAHELGTPLATIQVVAKELTRSTAPDDPTHEDAQLLVSQAQRCREILKRLSRQPESGDDIVAHTTLSQLLDEVAEPYRSFGPEVSTAANPKDASPEPILVRSPETVHALAAFVENAVDFAAENVLVVGHYDADTITIEVADDGPGFSPNVMAKLGEPYVTTRPNAEGSRTGHVGMGLGFFIAKTLLERTGADVTFRNGRKGALVCVCWDRQRIEAGPEALS